MEAQGEKRSLETGKEKTLQSPALGPCSEAAGNKLDTKPNPIPTERPDGGHKMPGEE
jgi:hypothetical protein